MGATFGPEGMQQFYACGACNKSYTVCAKLDDGEDARISKGPQFCFDGAHTSAALDVHDERRVMPNTVHLTAGPNLQREIDSLPGDVVTLVVSAGTRGWDDSLHHRLQKSLPRLESLQLVDVPFKVRRTARYI